MRIRAAVARRYSLRGTLAAAVLCVQAVNIGDATTALAYKTYDGFRAGAEGTWVNDLAGCFGARSASHAYAFRDAPVRFLIGTACRLG